MKEYRVTVSFGDGNPKTTTIKAETGYQARVKAFDTFACARNVHVLGLVSTLDGKKDQEHLSISKQPPLVYGCDASFPKEEKQKQKVIPIYLDNKEINPIVLEVIRLRKEGLSQVKIAKTLDISRGAVRRFLEANLDQSH